MLHFKYCFCMKMIKMIRLCIRIKTGGIHYTGKKKVQIIISINCIKRSFTFIKGTSNVLERLRLQIKFWTATCETFTSFCFFVAMHSSSNFLACIMVRINWRLLKTLMISRYCCYNANSFAFSWKQYFMFH